MEVELRIYRERNPAAAGFSPRGERILGGAPPVSADGELVMGGGAGGGEGFDGVGRRE